MLEGSDAELSFVNRLRPHFPGDGLDERLSGLAGELLESLAASGDAKSFVEAFVEYPVFWERNGPEAIAFLLEDAEPAFLDEVRKHPALREILEEFGKD